MADKKIEGADSSHIVSSAKSLQYSVGPNLIEGTDEDDSNNLEETVSANFVAPSQQEHLLALVLAENKSNLQEISVEQKIPTGVYINLSPKVDSSELRFSIEVHDGIPSSSSKANEPMEAQDDSNTAGCMFEASKQQECPISLILTEKKGDLQEVSVEQTVPCGDYVALSPKADGGELTSTNEVLEGFLTSSCRAYDPKEAQDESFTMDASEINVCAASYSTLRLTEGIQDEASCIGSGKVTCETPHAILERVKEDKPLVVHIFHKRQMSLGDTRQKVPAPLSRANTSKYFRMDKTIIDTTSPIESVKLAASKFGGSINWKARRTQTALESDQIELDKLKNKISECKNQAEAAEDAKLSVLNELERTKQLINEMKHVLEREQTEEVDLMEDLELVQFILQAMEGVACNDNAVVGEKLNNIQERRQALIVKVMSVKDELGKAQQDYDSLLIETDISINKAKAAFTMSKDAEKEVEELTMELQRLKDVFDLANATCQDLEAVHAKAQECRDRMDKVLQDAAQEVDEAKVIASNAQEELRKAKEEVEQAKAALSTVEFRLDAVLRDIQVAKESERLALNTLRKLEDGMVAVNVKQGPSQMIALSLDDYTSLVQKSRQAEESVCEKTAAGIAQVEAAKESESRTLSKLNEISKALEEQKQAVAAATEQASIATAGKLAMEQELRKWREENRKRRLKAGEASKSAASARPSSSSAEIVGRDTKCAGKANSCAAMSFHPVSDASGRSSPNDVVLQVKTKKEKLSFFPRVSKFLGCWAGDLELRSLSFRM